MSDTYTPKYPLGTLKEIREMLASKDVDIDPWKRLMYEKFLNAYEPTTKEVKIPHPQKRWWNSEKQYPPTVETRTVTPKFAERFDKYYSPFMVGANAATQKDLIPNTYKEVTPFDNIHQIKNKYMHNESINKYAAADPFVTAGAHGAGLAAATAFGGIPGLVGGLAIKHGAPLVWDLVKQKMAARAGARAESESKYRKIKSKYPLF
jgi:hypothetical protein